MGKLSRRMRELKSQDNRATDRRSHVADVPSRPPVADDPGWVEAPLPIPPPSPRANHNLLMFAFIVAVIVVMNVILWRGGGDLPVIDPATGRQVNQSAPWE